MTYRASAAAPDFFALRAAPLPDRGLTAAAILSLKGGGKDLNDLNAVLLRRRGRGALLMGNDPMTQSPAKPKARGSAKGSAEGAETAAPAEKPVKLRANGALATDPEILRVQALKQSDPPAFAPPGGAAAAPKRKPKTGRLIIPSAATAPQDPASDREFLIAVGMPITEHPPHRTVRAAFPHTALTLGV
jgi:hypothetical protein